MNHYELLYLKELHPYHQLIHVNFRGHEFVFRSLGRHEYYTLLKLGEDELTFEDAVCQTALVYPEDYLFNESPHAGISRQVCPMVMEMSGLLSIDDVFDIYEEQKKKNESFDSECMNIIKAAMPEYTYEEMETWTWEKLMRHVVRAERVLYLRGIDNIVLKRNEPDVSEDQPMESIDNPEVVRDLLERGIDPMFYFKHEVEPKKRPLVDQPFLGGRHWNDEGVLYAIRQQMGR